VVHSFGNKRFSAVSIARCLHCMQSVRFRCRSVRMSVCLSVCPSVCLSHLCIVYTCVTRPELVLGFEKGEVFSSETEEVVKCW